MAEDEHEGASAQEQLIEACRRDNTDLLEEVLDGRSEEEAARLLNETTTVLGNHLYHEAAAQGNYDIIDVMLDRPGFECDPIAPRSGDTPLHTVVRWSNAEPPTQQPLARALVSMMLEAGSNPRFKNKAGLTAAQLVDPRYPDLRQLLQTHEYALLNAGDFVTDNSSSKAPAAAPPETSALPPPRLQDPNRPPPPPPPPPPPHDDDDEFSGSDEDERAEWERQRQVRRGGR